jgi:hypothetical protein
MVKEEISCSSAFRKSENGALVVGNSAPGIEAALRRASYATSNHAEATGIRCRIMG